jgi:hypothetical protein
VHKYDAFAAELKFVVDEQTAEVARQWVRRELDADPHAVSGGDGYQTASLYFDTRDFDVFFRRRSSARAKYRIRRYNNGPVVFLERKMKVEGRLFKRRSECTVEDLDRIGQAKPDWNGSWFDRRLENRGFLPVCQVSYNRMARVGMSPTGPLRLTIDTQVSAVIVDKVAFSNDVGQLLLPGQAVLEMKYRVQLPVLFKRLIEELSIAPRSVSKYRTAVGRLNLVSGSEETEKMAARA